MPKLKRYQVVFKKDKKTRYRDFYFKSLDELFTHFKKYVKLDIEEIREYVYVDVSLFTGQDTLKDLKLSYGSLVVRIPCIKKTVDTSKIKQLFFQSILYNNEQIEQLNKFTLSQKKG